MLFGEHAVVYGRPCIVTAVDQRIYVSVSKNKGKRIIVSAPEVDINNYSVELNDLEKVEYPKKFQFVLRAIENFFNKYKVYSGLKVTTHSEFSSLFGFGSSSAVTVCTLMALYKLFDIKINNKSLFDISYKTVLDIQGVGSGFDLAAAIWGGTLYFVGGGKKISPIKVNNLPLIVGYTGIKADTAPIVMRVAGLRKENRKGIDKIFDSIDRIVEKAKISLGSSDYSRLGFLMDENQDLLSKLGVSSTELDSLIFAARSTGAYGAKLSGAGGGDCMVSVASTRLKSIIGKSIEKAGGKVIPVRINAEGVKIK